MFLSVEIVISKCISYFKLFWQKRSVDYFLGETNIVKKTITECMCVCGNGKGEGLIGLYKTHLKILFP